MRPMNASDLTLTIVQGATPGASATEIVSEPRRVSAFDIVASQPWAIQPAMLETISAIARRDNESVETLEARLGRKLQNTRSVSMRDGVAIVPLTGPVFRYANLFSEISGATSLDTLARDFNAALDDATVKAVVLAIDSPGGQANGIAEFAQMVRAAGKPVIAYVDGSAASAAYWIAAAADEIVLAKTAEVGSIGAVVSIDTSGKNPRVVEIVSSQSPNKRPDVTTDAGRAQIQQRIDAFAQVFIEDVAAYRGVTPAHVVEHYGAGGMRMGAEAVRLGMADRVSTLEEVIAGLAGKTVKGATLMASAEAGAPAAENPVITREFLAAHHPELVAAIHAEGAQAELARVLAVQAQALPGHEKLIAECVADGKTSGPEAAVKVLAAERALAGERRSALAADRQAPVAFAAAPSAADDAAAGAADSEAADAALPLEARCEKQWNSQPALRDEFASLAAFTAYTRATESGRARVFKQK